MTFAEQVKATVDIVSVVSEYVKLRKAGQRYVGLCPFHTEKSPSFGVNSVHQYFKCFGCGKGGDLFGFVMEIEGLSFWEALKQIAERNGIPIPKRTADTDLPENRLRSAIYQMHEVAEQTFRSALQGSAGSEARAYLQKRGLSKDSIEQFGIGYAAQGGLLRLLQQQGFTAEQMIESGLIGKRDDGSLYDRFRNRIMFPIHSETGKVIAFGGRALDPNDPAKYMNSPETSIYKKSQVLYNLHRAKQGIRKNDRTVLVEGYMDVVGVYSAGITEVVATCGTALTPEQVRAIRRHSGRIIVNFDPDNAGANAAERSIVLLLDEGMHIRILELDDGLDPDEYCKERGAEAYNEKLVNARSFFLWLAERARGKFDMRSAEGRVEGFKFLLPSIQKVPDKIERVAVANEVAAYLGVDSGLVLETFRKAAADRKDARFAPPADPLRPDEKILINLLLSNFDACDELIPELQEIPAVEQFRSRNIFHVLFTLYGSREKIGFQQVHDRLEENDRNLLSSVVLLHEHDETVFTIEQGRECVKSMRSGDSRADLRARIKELERAGKFDEALALYSKLDK